MRRDSSAHGFCKRVCGSRERDAAFNLISLISSEFPQIGSPGEISTDRTVFVNACQLAHSVLVCLNAAASA